MSKSKYKLLYFSSLATNFLQDYVLPETYIYLDRFPRKKIRKKKPAYFIEHRKKPRKYSIYQSVFPYPIISREVVDVFENFGCKNVYFLPVEIRHTNGDLLFDDYYLINNLNIRNIINEKKSKINITNIEGSEDKLYITIRKFVPEYDRGDGLPVLEMKEWPNRFFVIEELANEFKKAKIKHLTIRDPEDEEWIKRF